VSNSFWSVGLAAALLVGAWAWSADADSIVPSGAYASASGRGELITYCVPAEGRPTALTVIDPAVRRIAIYHVNRETGEIQLKSVRNIAWDLGMEYFNSGSPLPEEIRKGLERQP
jgi:hypothetical protein